MATIKALLEDDDTGGDREIHGQWWRPEDPTTRVGGRLVYTPEAGGVLTLTGALPADAPEDGPHVLLGLTTENEHVTLPNAYYRGHSGVHMTLNEDEVVTRQEWLSFEVWIGAAFDLGDQTELSSFELITDDLSWWVRRPCPEVDHGAEGGTEVRLTMAVQSPVEAHLEGAAIGIEWGEQWSTGLTTSVVSMTPKIVVRCATPQTHEALWEDFISPLLFLITLATGSPQRIRRLVFNEWSSEPFGGRRVVALPSRWTGVQSRQTTARFWEYPLPFEDVEARFGDAVRCWFDLYQDTREALLEFFTAPLTPRMYMEESFTRTVRALEMWHRRRFGGEYMPDAQFQALRTKILDQLEGAELELVRMRLNYGNELTLKQRLDALVEMSGEPVKTLLVGVDRFNRRVVNRRNEMTHGGGATPTLTDDQLPWAEKLLHAMFYAVLLRELGFDAGYVNVATRRSPLWSWAQAVPPNLVKS